MTDLISVIIPVYNAENSIGTTLESVRKQTWKGSFEIIIIDDGSTDRSIAIVESFRLNNPSLDIKIVRQSNRGVSAARNRGLKMATGNFLALLDADDVWLPEKTKLQMHYLKNDSLDIDFLSCVRVGHRVKFPYSADQNGLIPVTFQKLLLRNEIPTPTVIFKRKILENTGFFSESHRFAEDHNYWLKIARKNRMFILNKELVVAGGGKRSFGASGLSGNLREMEKGFQKTLVEMKELTFLSPSQYIFYKIFYSSKYILRLARNQYYKLKGR